MALALPALKFLTPSSNDFVIPPLADLNPLAIAALSPVPAALKPDIGLTKGLVAIALAPPRKPPSENARPIDRNGLAIAPAARPPNEAERAAAPTARFLKPRPPAPKALAVTFL